jgi:hypothetical protein
MYRGNVGKRVFHPPLNCHMMIRSKHLEAYESDMNKIPEGSFIPVAIKNALEKFDDIIFESPWRISI